MPIRPESRFAKLPILEVVAADGSRRHVVALGLATPARPAPAGARHRVTHGEAVDLLARRYLGAERLWWRILDANALFYPLELVPGSLLNLPAAGPATRAVRTRSF